jgi:hypothetical protein
MVQGPSPAQVTDLHPNAQACALGTPDLRLGNQFPEPRVPAPSSGSLRSMCPAAAGPGDWSHSGSSN